MAIGACFRKNGVTRRLNAFLVVASTTSRNNDVPQSYPRNSHGLTGTSEGI